MIDYANQKSGAKVVLLFDMAKLFGKRIGPTNRETYFL